MRSHMRAALELSGSLDASQPYTTPWKQARLYQYTTGRILPIPGMTQIRKVPSRSVNVASKVLL